MSGTETLSRNHPILNMIRQRSQASSAKGASATDDAAAAAAASDAGLATSCTGEGPALVPTAQENGNEKAMAHEETHTPFMARKKTDYHYSYVDQLVLKVGRKRDAVRPNVVSLIDLCFLCTHVVFSLRRILRTTKNRHSS